VIPSTASVHCAAGLLQSDIVHEDLVTSPMVVPVEIDQIARIFERLSRRIENQLKNDGFASDQVLLERSIDMRYTRQTHIVTVPVDDVWPFDTPLMNKTIDRFEELYRDRYGRDSGFREAGIELVSFRVRGTGRFPRTKAHRRLAGTTARGDAMVERRRVWVDDRSDFIDVDGYVFDKIRSGDAISGPAIIWTPNTTIVLGSPDTATMDANDNLIMDLTNT
jgi:N-methylhydantoinase A